MTDASNTMTLEELTALVKAQGSRIAEQDQQLKALRPRTAAEQAELDNLRRLPAPDGGPRTDTPDGLLTALQRTRTIEVRRKVRAGPNDDGITVINEVDFDATKHTRLDAPAVAPTTQTNAPTPSGAALPTRDDLLKLTHAAISALPEAKALQNPPASKTELVDAIVAARG